MKKIGIVTFHSAYNFGALLQCIALKKVLEDRGEKVEIINHINSRIKQSYSLMPPLGLRSGLNYLLTIWSKIRLSIVYEKFIKDIMKIDVKQSENWNGFKAIIWGSDQIWNTDLTDNDGTYWGDVECGDTIKVSYAASAGHDLVSLAEHQELLQQFKTIGVREEDLQEALKNIGIEAELNVDPTLLLSAKEWNEVLPIRDNPEKQEYILLYGIRNYQRAKSFAEKMSEVLNLKVIELHSSQFNLLKLGISTKHDRRLTASPLDFVRLIKHARYVVTDSFHGTVFSVIFHKPFFSMNYKMPNDNRANSLLNALALKDRFVMPEEFSEDLLLKYIDYVNVDNLKDNIVSKSKEYLFNALK